jgi:competence protein ComEC
VLGLVILALTLGIWRAGDYAAARTSITGLIGQKVSVTGTVADDPAYATGKTGRPYMNFKLGELSINGRPAPGEISVYMYQTNLHRGWRVAATGKMAPGFGNSPAELSYPTLTITSRVQSPLEQARQRFFTGMRTALPEPIASFALGLLVGIRALIPKDMQAQLTAVGLSHLVAVSGYNLTIIVAAASRLLDRFGRGVTLAACFWLIGSFLIVTGASASIVRASFVAVLALLASFYGRRFNPTALILLAAAATAAYKPSYLTDLGWLLSFLAFFGIMVLAPAVTARLGNPKPLIAKLFIETTSAQLLTLPLILYIFGNLSPAAPLANLLILPLVPLAMLVCFIAGLAGLFIPAFAGWFAWPAALFLGAILQLIAALAALPGGGATYRLSVWAMLAIYALILVWLVSIRRANIRAHRIADHTATKLGSAEAAWVLGQG